MADGLALLKDALRRGQVDAGDMERAGRLLQKDLPKENTLSVRVIGQCTTTWFPPLLTAVAWGRGLALQAVDGDYDNTLQELERHDASDVLVLVPWTARLLAHNNPAEAIASELSFWESAWARRKGARLVMVGYDLMGPGPDGLSLGGAPGGRVETVRAMNAALRARLPAGAAWVDLEQIAGMMGRSRFYDPRRYHWSKMPFSEEGLVLLCRHLHAAIRAITTGPKKVLVLDLDNTLWGGVVGETGPQGIAIRESPDGEAFRAFQRHAQGLNRRGVLLAVASKNNLADAQEPFLKNTDMILSLSDFAGFEASWDPKAEALKRLAKNLRLGLDSFVFFDDNPAEREHIRQALPEVEVVDVPEEPALYVQALEEGLWFEAVSLTAADRERAAQYQVEAQRQQAEQSFASLDDYLLSLDMTADIRNLNQDDLERVVQLLGKTNQFNLTTYRHGNDVVQAMIDNPDSIALTVRVKDRFGDHGLVAVLLGIPLGEGTIMVDSFLMSCRVIGRTVEQYTWSVFLAQAKAKGYQQVQAVYLPTAKNAQVIDFYDQLGLSQVEVSAEGARYYRADLAQLVAPKNFVHGV